MQSFSWPPEHSAALREHVARGMCYAEAVELINAWFGTAYIRRAAAPPNRRRRPSSAPSRQSCASVAISPRLVFLLDLGSGESRYPYGGDVDRRAYTLCRYPRLKSLYVSVACTWKAMLSDAPPPTRESPESHRLMQLLKEMQGN